MNAPHTVPVGSACKNTFVVWDGEPKVCSALLTAKPDRTQQGNWWLLWYEDRGQPEVRELAKQPSAGQPCDSMVKLLPTKSRAHCNDQLVTRPGGDMASHGAMLREVIGLAPSLQNGTWVHN